MNILDLLEADHEKVENIFSKIEASKDAKKLTQLLEQLDLEFTLHAQAEELVFYPAMREYDETEDYIEEAEIEHEEARALLEVIKTLEPTASEFKAQIAELKEAILHHVEEEESEIFEAVQECMEEEELQELGQEFQETKARLQQDLSLSQ